ncbi:MAG TPA: aminotransferase class I/II-fold pyridoxal phosphate-dependent enzyme, partial [Alphaproteobacteria bacterium]|nr:aminotransferase class I/II-fold pyridoxal phosphate-dependent enzyme [Alphaproteobacteria bacterium]
APAQYAGIAALNGPQDCVKTMRQAFAKRRRALVSGLNQLAGVRCTEPFGAFYAMPNITGTGHPSRELEVRLLEEAGVAAISGTSFGVFGEGYLRFSYAADLAEIEEALARMGRFLAETGGGVGGTRRPLA